MEAALQDPNKFLWQLKNDGKLSFKLVSIIDKMIEKRPKKQFSLYKIKGLLRQHRFFTAKTSPTNTVNNSSRNNSDSYNSEYSKVKQSEKIKIRAKKGRRKSLF